MLVDGGKSRDQPTTGDTDMFTAEFGGKTYSNNDIERFELKQARSALALWKSRGRPAADIFTEEELATSNALYEKWLAEANGQLKSTEVTMQATGITAEEFLEHFQEMARDEPTMLAANPEHYLIRVDADGIHGIEVCGGVPLHVFFRFGDELLDQFPTTPGYPVRQVAKGYTKDGTFIVGGLHQFRNTDDGFEGILGILYGSAIPDDHLTYHQQHLAVEFHNWYRFALDRLGRKQ
jgi:hypothetical protein